jgi:hypothetical protein
MSVKADNEAWLFSRFLHEAESLHKGGYVLSANRQLVAATWWAKKKSGDQKINFLFNISGLLDFVPAKAEDSGNLGK